MQTRQYHRVTSEDNWLLHLIYELIIRIPTVWVGFGVYSSLLPCLSSAYLWFKLSSDYMTFLMSDHCILLTTKHACLVVRSRSSSLWLGDQLGSVVCSHYTPWSVTLREGFSLVLTPDSISQLLHYSCHTDKSLPLIIKAPLWCTWLLVNHVFCSPSWKLFFSMPAFCYDTSCWTYQRIIDVLIKVRS